MHWPLRIVAGCLAALPFVVPLSGVALPVPGMLGPSLAVRFLAVVALPFAVVAGWGSWHRILRQPVMLAAGAWLAVSVVATIAGVDPLRSLWGEPQRAEGVLQWFAWGALLVAAAVAFREPSARRSFVLSGMLAGLAFGSAAVVEETVRWLSSDVVFNYRIYGVFLNPLFFGNAMILSAGCALLLARMSSGRLRRLASVAAAALTVIALASGARTVLLGAVGALLAAAVLALAVGWRPPALRLRSARSIVLLLLVCAGLLLASPHFFSRLDDWNAADPSIAARLVVWRNDLAAIRERPWLGWGPDNHLIVFYDRFTPDFYRFTTDVFDRAHNGVVETLVTTGVVGLLAVLAFVAALATAMIRFGRRQPARRGEAVILAGIFGYAFASDIFGFQTQYTLAFLVPLAGLVVSATFPAANGPQRVAGRGRALAVGLVGCAALAYLAAAVVLPMRAGLLAVRSLDRYAEDLPGATGMFAAATAIPSFVDGLAAKRFAHLVSQEILTRQVRDPELVLAAGRLVGAVLAREEAAHPWDPTLVMLHASLLEQLGKLDPVFFAQSGPMLEALVARYPARFESRQLLALVYLRQGRTAEAVAQYETMLAQNDALAPLHELYAITLYRAGRLDDALSALERALILNPSHAPRIERIRERILSGAPLDPSLPGEAPVATDMNGQGVVEP